MVSSWIVIQARRADAIRQSNANDIFNSILLLQFFYVCQIGEIQPGSSKQINITVQIDPKRVLSVGKYFLSVPSFILYEQRMASNAAKLFVGSIESVTLNFTVKEGN